MWTNDRSELKAFDDANGTSIQRPRIPRFVAMVTACVRSLAASFAKMLFICGYALFRSGQHPKDAGRSVIARLRRSLVLMLRCKADRSGHPRDPRPASDGKS
jgi:hypothetical protein